MFQDKTVRPPCVDTLFHCQRSAPAAASVADFAITRIGWDDVLVAPGSPPGRRVALAAAGQKLLRYRSIQRVSCLTILDCDLNHHE